VRRLAGGLLMGPASASLSKLASLSLPMMRA
jgi:hypothetical protein